MSSRGHPTTITCRGQAVVIRGCLQLRQPLDPVFSRGQVIAAVSIVMHQALHDELVLALWNSASALRLVLVAKVYFFDLVLLARDLSVARHDH